MDMTEKRLARQTVYEGKILHVHRDTVLLPNGAEAIREVAEHPGGVAIVAVDSDDCVLTVKQYRYVFSQIMEEIPAGKLERGEDPDDAALRELREETGAMPERFTKLGSIIVSPGCYGEVLHLYLAEGLRFGETDPDEDEFLNIERHHIKDLVRMCMTGEIDDAKTVVAVLKANTLLYVE